MENAPETAVSIVACVSRTYDACARADTRFEHICGFNEDKALRKRKHEATGKRAHTQRLVPDKKIGFLK